MSNASAKCTVTPSAHHFVKEAIALLVSESMRAWASSPANLPIITQMAREAIRKDPKLEPQRFATYLTCIAMG